MTESDLSHWKTKVEPVMVPEVQTCYAIVDELGRPTQAAAILFSPYVQLNPQEGELINCTLYATQEVAERMLASAKNSAGLHIVPYGGR